MVHVILDTDIFSEVLAGRDTAVALQATTYLQESRRFTISALTVFEVQKGLTHVHRPKTSREFTAHLPQLHVLPIRSEEAELGGVIHGLLKRQGQPIGEIDPLIAATAISYNLPLVTGNMEHYQRVVDLGFPLILRTWRSS